MIYKDSEPLSKDNLPSMEEAIIFPDSNTFSQFIELHAISSERTCTSVILEYCEIRDLEMNEVAKMISTPLKEKIKIEMQEAGLMRRVSQLSFE